MKLCVLLHLVVLICAPDAAAITSGHRARRSDDSQPLQAVVMQLAAQLDELQSQVSANNNNINTKLTNLQAQVDTQGRKVAFLAQVAGSPKTLPNGSPYKFDQVIFNDGNAYDPAQGVFTAPYPGVYVFSVQLFTFQRERALVDIKVNGKMVSRMSIDTNDLPTTNNEDEESDATTVTVKLQSGDRVWIQSAYHTSTYYGDHHTYFTGFLLYATQ